MNGAQRTLSLVVPGLVLVIGLLWSIFMLEASDSVRVIAAVVVIVVAIVLNRGINGHSATG